MRRAITGLMLNWSALWRSSQNIGSVNCTRLMTGARWRTEASESWVCACFKVNQGAACGPTVTPSTSTASVQGWMRTAAMVTGVPRASVAAASMRGRAQSGNHMPTPPVQAAATAATPARGLSQARQRAAGATEGAESGRVIEYGTPVQADVWMVPLTPAERTSPSATRSEEGQPRGRV